MHAVHAAIRMHMHMHIRIHIHIHIRIRIHGQSFLAGVPRIIVGLRDDAGLVLELKPIETMKIPRMVRYTPPPYLTCIHPIYSIHPILCTSSFHRPVLPTRCAASRTCGTPRSALTSARPCSSGCSSRRAKGVGKQLRKVVYTCTYLLTYVRTH